MEIKFPTTITIENMILNYLLHEFKAKTVELN